MFLGQELCHLIKLLPYQHSHAVTPVWITPSGGNSAKCLGWGGINPNHRLAASLNKSGGTVTFCGQAARGAKLEFLSEGSCQSVIELWQTIHRFAGQATKWTTIAIKIHLIDGLHVIAESTMQQKAVDQETWPKYALSRFLVVKTRNAQLDLQPLTAFSSLKADSVHLIVKL